MAGYCSVTDLMLGNIPMPSYIDKQQQVDSAAEEIDAKIGFKYNTPIDISQTSPVDRPAILLLKKINAFIATGRILMAVDAAGEDEQVHAYANRLLKEAYAALDAIAAGSIELTGAALNTSTTPKTTAVIVNNVDDESLVEAFYDRIANPSYTYPSYVPTANGGFVL